MDSRSYRLNSYHFIFFIFIAFLLGLRGDYGRFFVPHLQSLISLILFIIGYTINFNSICSVIRNRHILIFKLLVLRLITLPILAFLIHITLQLKNEYWVGLACLSIAPPAMISIVFSRIFGGEQSINIITTFLATIISPITISISSAILITKTVWVSLTIFNGLFLIILFPISVGLLAQAIKKPNLKIETILDIFLKLAVALIIFILASANHNLILSYESVKLFCALIVFYIISFIIAERLISSFITTENKIKIAAKYDLSLNDCALSSMLASSYSYIAMLPSTLAAIGQILIISLVSLMERIWKNERNNF